MSALDEIKKSLRSISTGSGLTPEQHVRLELLLRYAPDDLMAIRNTERYGRSSIIPEICRIADELLRSEVVLDTEGVSLVSHRTRECTRHEPELYDTDEENPDSSYCFKCYRGMKKNEFGNWQVCDDVE